MVLPKRNYTHSGTVISGEEKVCLHAMKSIMRTTLISTGRDVVTPLSGTVIMLITCTTDTFTIRMVTMLMSTY